MRTKLLEVTLETRREWRGCKCARGVVLMEAVSLGEAEAVLQGGRSWGEEKGGWGEGIRGRGRGSRCRFTVYLLGEGLRQCV